MKDPRQNLSVVAVAATLPSAASAEPLGLDDFLRQIKDPDDMVRGAACAAAGPLGAPAVKPLASLCAGGELEVARTAKRALWKIVRHAGRPGADSERRAVAGQLLELLNTEATTVRRETLWMLSEIGGNDAVPAIAALLTQPETREDARAALERIPGKESVSVLEAALQTVPEDFKPAVAQSLRVRGVKVNGYPSQKLVPTRPSQSGTRKMS